MSNEHGMIDRREAIARVGALLGGITFVGGSALLTACEKARGPERTAAAGKGVGKFSTDDIAFLDEVADTILPTTSTPGAKAAQTGAFMALMVTDTYEDKDQDVFRDGIKKLDEASQKMHKTSFMKATPQQRLALLEQIDREAKDYTDRREAAQMARARQGQTKTADTKTAQTKAGDTAQVAADTAAKKAAEKAEAQLPDQRSEKGVGGESNPAPAITADAPPHYFRMMKELAMLGYFTSEIGYTQAMRYVESPGRYDPCVPYTKGEKSWAPHA